jgi:hypothetical protein
LLDSCDPISEPLSKLFIFRDLGCHGFLLASLPSIEKPLFPDWHDLP